MSCVFLFFFFFFLVQPQQLTLSTVNSAFVHCSRSHKLHFSATFLFKMGPTVLFTHLKIISLQCFQFQFSVSAKIISHIHTHIYIYIYIYIFFFFWKENFYYQKETTTTYIYIYIYFFFFLERKLLLPKRNNNSSA